MKLDEAANTLENFLAMADLEEPTKDNLERAFGLERADVFVLFGGSILQGVDTLARAMEEKLAKTYVIVGGAGHTTDTLREVVKSYYPETETEGRTEAELFDDCLYETYGHRADLLETKSTNCGKTISRSSSISWKKTISNLKASSSVRMSACSGGWPPHWKST